MFEAAKWIWIAAGSHKDQYVDFTDIFVSDKNGKDEICIAADSDYTLWVNGRLAGFGQYSDYPHYKIGDRIDISEYTVKGENSIAVTVWYYGHNSQTYILGSAGLIYEVRCDGKIAAASSTATPSRRSPAYVQGECKEITGQLGITYHADLMHADGFPLAPDAVGFAPSVEVTDISYDISPRPIKRLVLGDRCPGTVCQQGVFNKITYTGKLGDDLHKASLAWRKLKDMTGSHDRAIREGMTFSCADGDGIYLIVDLGEENVGFLDVDFTVDTDCRVDVSFGEHLQDGRCRSGVGRNFSCALDAKQGRNQYLNTFRRFGCRYLQFFFHAPRVEISYLGLRPVTYPLTHKEFKTQNLLRDTIYDVCCKTLECCMHVHYEDCPWREQALYTMDSRNQMLCGYYAFGEKDFARASLKLISKGLRPDGILSLCYPAGKDFPIPAFSLVYFIQMNEYIRYTEDTSLATECMPLLKELISTFANKTQAETGLIENFHGGTEYWNFYEWSPTMSGALRKEQTLRLEAPLNAFYSLALQNLAQICTALGDEASAAEYLAQATRTNAAIAANFYNADTKLFESFVDSENGRYSVLTNSLCLLCGAAEGLDTSVILKILAANGAADTGLTVYPNTLSMNSFRFDALLAADFEKFRPVILDELDRNYFSMLRKDATTFWETILGEEDFANAGSLCHGWSALPVYYYHILNA